MRRDSATRWWQIAKAISRLTRTTGAHPSALALSQALHIHRRGVMRYLAAMKADDVVRCVGNGPSAGWTLTAAGARWIGEAVPVASSDGPSWWWRTNRWRRRAWNRRELLMARMATSEVFDRDRGDDETDSPEMLES